MLIMLDMLCYTKLYISVRVISLQQVCRSKANSLSHESTTHFRLASETLNDVLQYFLVHHLALVI